MHGPSCAPQAARERLGAQLLRFRLEKQASRRAFKLDSSDPTSPRPPQGEEGTDQGQGFAQVKRLRLLLFSDFKKVNPREEL